MNRLQRSTLMSSIIAICTFLLALTPASAQFLEPDVTVLATHLAEAPGDNFGWVAESIGDLDGDGDSDSDSGSDSDSDSDSDSEGPSEYVIGAILNAEGGPAAGKAYVYDGSSHSLIVTHVGAPGERLGYSINGRGDANDDGIPDYIISGPAFFGNGVTPRVKVFSGADHTVIHELTDAPGTLFGFDVGFVGDIDDDGHDDFVIGALTAAGFAGRVDMVSGADGATLWSVAGAAPGNLLGSSVTGLDDLNGDGVPDVGAGAVGANVAFVYDGTDGSILRTLTPEPTAGAFGQFFIHDAGDVNKDKVRDIYVGDFGDTIGGRGYVFSGKKDERLLLIDAENPTDGLGIGRGAGDVNDDKRDDILIGAYLNSDGAPQGGKCSLISGKTGETLRTFTLTVNNGQLGFDVVNLGDVTGDNATDFLLTGLDQAYVVAGLEADDDDSDSGSDSD